MPNWLRAGLATAFFIAIPGFLLSLTDWLSELAEWAAGDAVIFPDIGELRKAFVALVFAVVFGGINATVRFFQEKAQDKGLNAGSTPVYPTRTTDQ